MFYSRFGYPIKKPASTEAGLLFYSNRLQRKVGVINTAIIAGIKAGIHL